MFLMATTLRNLLVAQGKALPNTTFFNPGGSPIQTYVPGFGRNEKKRTILSQREAARHLQAYGGDQAIDWVFDAVGLYSDTAAGAPWHLTGKDGEIRYDEDDPFKPEGAKTADPALIRLLKKPNPFMDYEELMELLVIDLLLVGNAYWLKWRTNDKGQPLALYRMSPLHVKVIPGDHGIEGYTYQPEGVAEPVEFGLQDVIHYKRPNPHSPYYGLGVIKGGGRPYDLELALTDAQASYFENKADPSLIVQSERRVSRDVFNKLRAQLKSRVSGPGQAGELLVLEAGLKAMTLTPHARDAMYSELADKSRDRVLAMFRVNPKLLGMPSHSGESGGDKVQDIRREFDNKTMRPFLDRLQKRVTDEVTLAWDLTYQIDYRYTMPQEEAVKLSGDFGSIPGVKVKEVRRFLVEAGLLREESTGDDEIDETVLNLPGEELDEDGQGGFADRPLPREPGRPPLGENTRAFPKGTKARKPQGKALGSTMEELTERMRRVEFKAMLNDDGVNTGPLKVKAPQDPLARQREGAVNALAASIAKDLKNAAHELELELQGIAEGKAVTLSTLAKKVKASGAWRKFQSSVAEILERHMTAGLSTAGVQQGNVEDVDYEAIAKEIVYRPEGVRGITDTLRSQIIDGIADKEPGEAQAIIRDYIEKFTKSKADTIGLTEAVHAYNEGTLVALEAAGETQTYVFDGDDDDQPCIEANGQIWDIDFARQHRLEHPRCRRAFLAAPAVT